MVIIAPKTNSVFMGKSHLQINLLDWPYATIIFHMDMSIDIMDFDRQSNRTIACWTWLYHLNSKESCWSLVSYEDVSTEQRRRITSLQPPKLMCNFSSWVFPLRTFRFAQRRRSFLNFTWQIYLSLNCSLKTAMQNSLR